MDQKLLDIDFNDGEKLASLGFSPSDVERILLHVLRDQEVSAPCQVSVSIVSNEEIQKINREWRKVDASTDVISIECERPGDPDLIEGEIVSLGDIFLSPEYIEEQAKSFDSSLNKEATLLLVHAMLHLLGYNHIKDDEAKIMEPLEDRLVRELNEELEQ